MVKIVTATETGVIPELAQQRCTLVLKLCHRLLRIGPILGGHARPGVLLVALAEG